LNVIFASSAISGESEFFTKEDHNIIPDPFMIFKGDIEKDGLIS